MAEMIARRGWTGLPPMVDAVATEANLVVATEANLVVATEADTVVDGYGGGYSALVFRELWA